MFRMCDSDDVRQRHSRRYVFQTSENKENFSEEISDYLKYYMVTKIHCPTLLVISAMDVSPLCKVCKSAVLFWNFQLHFKRRNLPCLRHQPSQFSILP